jgi:biotin synthase
MNYAGEELIARAEGEHRLDKAEVMALLSCEGEIAGQLFAAADRVRRAYMGDEVHLRGIIEFSNHCERGCSYCGLRKPNATLARYRMDLDEIVAIAGAAVPLGYRTVVLQSGEDAFYTRDMLATLVARLKGELGVAVTLSVGERSFEEYRCWKEAGADRYLLKHETADPRLYAALHPDMSFGNRRRCLDDLRELGYQVGSGCMVGLPGQTVEALAGDVLLLVELDVEMAGIGPFIPHPRTPLGQFPGGTVDMTLKMLAVTRLLLPRVFLPATTALGTIDEGGRQKALQAGGNVVMPNITPNRYRRMYEIYPNKICLDDHPAHCRNCIGGIIASLGRTVATGPGHSPKERFASLTGQSQGGLGSR